MGLFTNKKNLCPVCGAPTPRILPTKVENMSICKECAGKIDIPHETVNAMTVDDFRQYLAFYDGNAVLRERFQNEYTFDVKGWASELEIDFTHGLFRLTDINSSIVFEASCIRSFQIIEDGYPLYEGDSAGLRCSSSEAPKYLDRLWPVYNEYLREKREYERMRAIVEATDKNGNSPHRNIPEPSFDAQKPVQQYHIILTMDHPYRTEFRGDLDGPDFSFLTPDLTETIQKYHELLDSVDVLAQNLMKLFAPNAPIRKMDSTGTQPLQAASASAAPVDAVAEIQRFKALMDQGIITEEEFTAKKRQLLGI